MADIWEALKAECAACRGCALADTRTNVVFGDGSETAEIMLIGEGPGQHEDEQGVPFVGRAGQLLDDMLEIIHLDRTKVYIANVVKCRPPQNRDPLNVEQDACIGYLRRQAALVQPKIIVCLGRIAAMRLIRPDFASRGSMASGSSGTACAILPCTIPRLCCGTRRAARRHTRTC